MSVKKYSLKRDGERKLSANFKVSEFACKDGSDAILIAEELVAILQNIRDHFGKAVSITSAYRNEAYNRKIGGASKSQHIQGTAADIVVSGISPLEVAQYAEYLMPKTGGIGLYGSFTHVDVRGARSRFKDNGKEIAVSGFPGYEPDKASGAAIIQALMDGSLKVQITEKSRAINAVDKAKSDPVFSSLYWILYKLVN